MSHAQNIDIANFEIADLVAIRNKAAELRAEEMSRMMSALSAWTKNLFSFGFMRHA